MVWASTSLSLKASTGWLSGVEATQGEGIEDDVFVTASVRDVFGFQYSIWHPRQSVAVRMRW